MLHKIETQAVPRRLKLIATQISLALPLAFPFPIELILSFLGNGIASGSGNVYYFLKETKMPRVDFHVLNQDKEQWLNYLARLVEKIYLLNKQIFIFTESLIESNEIDDILWTFRPDSFLPHHIFDQEKYPAPILISHVTIPLHKEILINIRATVPEFYTEYNRIIEVIYADQTIKQQGREKYKQYQNLGCQLHTFHS